MQDTTTLDQPKAHPMPFVRLELAVMTVQDGALSVLQARRQEAPHAGRWALPGGVLRIDLDRDLEAAAQRVAKERLGVSLPYLRQLGAIGGARRDPRAPWALSVVYRALIPAGVLAPQPGKRIEALRWTGVDGAITDHTLAFDHAQLIEKALMATRAEIEGLELPEGFLPEVFTLGELQQACESLLGRRLDKSSFRRKLNDRGCVEPVAGTRRAGAAHRPAQVYRLAVA